MRGCLLVVLASIGIVVVVAVSMPKRAAQPVAKNALPAPAETKKPEPPKPAPAPKKEPLEIAVSTSVAVMAHYEANEVRADEDMKGKWLIVAGEVSAIGKDILGSPYIAMKTNNVIGSCQFMFSNKDEAAKLSGVNKGEKLMIAGRCEGKLGNVLFRGCQFVPSTTPKKGERYIVTPID